MLEQKIVTGGEIALYDEIGRIGQNRWGGSFYEEFLPELRGQRGVKVYTEMESNDDVIGAIIFALDTLLRQAQFSVEPQGDDQKDIEVAEFVESCMNDMQNTWTDTVSEILSSLHTAGRIMRSYIRGDQGGQEILRRTANMMMV